MTLRWLCATALLLGCSGSTVRPILWAYPSVPMDDPASQQETSLELIWNDSTVLPIYPNGPALWSRTTTEVSFWFTVLPDGTVQPGSIRFMFSPVKELHRPTSEAVLRWRFVPFGVNGNDAPRETAIAIGYLLGEACTPGKPDRVARWDLSSSSNKILYVTHCIPKLVPRDQGPPATPSQPG